jgi:anti-sigma B factor antagonist
MPPMLEIRARRGAGRLTLALAGELDFDSSDEVVHRLARAVHAGAQIVIDLRQLTFIDVAGVDTLRRCALCAADDGWTLTITGAPPHVRRVLRLAGAESVLPLLP